MSLFQAQNPRTYRTIGAICLVIGLCIWLFVNPVTQQGKDLTHFLVGALVGFSFAINIISLRRGARTRSLLKQQPPESPSTLT